MEAPGLQLLPGPDSEGLKGWTPLNGGEGGRWGPNTVVLFFYFGLIVFHFSTRLCVSLLCCRLRRASLPSH